MLYYNFFLYFGLHTLSFYTTCILESYLHKPTKPTILIQYFIPLYRYILHTPYTKFLLFRFYLTLYKYIISLCNIFLFVTMYLLLGFTKSFLLRFYISSLLSVFGFYMYIYLCFVSFYISQDYRLLFYVFLQSFLSFLLGMYSFFLFFLVYFIGYPSFPKPSHLSFAICYPLYISIPSFQAI